MAFEQGNKFGKYTKRGKNKSSDILKSQLHNLANKVVDEFDLGKLTNNQRILLIKAVIPFLIPRKKEIEVGNQLLEQPIFNVINKINEEF